MSYLRLFDHEGKMLTETIISNPPIPRIGEELVLDDGKHYFVKKVLHDVARSPHNGLYLGAEVTLHADNVVTCEHCDANFLDTDPTVVGCHACPSPSKDPHFEHCGGLLVRANGKRFYPAIR